MAAWPRNYVPDSRTAPTEDRACLCHRNDLSRLWPVTDRRQGGTSQRGSARLRNTEARFSPSRDLRQRELTLTILAPDARILATTLIGTRAVLREPIRRPSFDHRLLAVIIRARIQKSTMPASRIKGNARLATLLRRRPREARIGTI